MSTRIYPPARRIRLGPIVLAVTIACAIAWVAMERRPRKWAPVHISNVGGDTMGGTWSVKFIRLRPGTTVRTLQSSTDARLAALEADLTTYTHDSPVSRFNRHRGTEWFDVPQDLADVVAGAQSVSEKTKGSFDITVAPLVNLWGFGPEPAGLRSGRVPVDDAIAAARAHVGYQKLHVRSNPPALRKDDPELAIDLSAIGKGYAAGQLAADLDAMGVTDYLIAVGGELRAKGVGPDGRPWPAGIEVPAPDTRRILRTLELRDAGLSTSGDYRNFVEVAGQRFSHEIDPRTGRPITGNLASVSVVHPDSAYADAMATGLMVLGADEGYALAQRLHLAALFVIRGEGQFETRATPEFERLTVSNPVR
jgi:thiamine biosynthesis lipoprotein